MPITESQGLANTTRPVDDCRTGNQVIYTTLSYLMMAEFTLALPLNLSVLYVFLFRFKFWKTNSVFLFNVVVADLLLLACLPFKAYHYQNGQRRSQDKELCKTMLFMLFLNRGASVAFLTVISIDRYLNVVHPGRKNFVRALKKSPHISVLIWLLLLPLTIPTMLKTFECCNSHGRVNETYGRNVVDSLREVVFFTQILVPFLVLLYCTLRIVNRLKRKTVGDRTRLRRAVFLVSSVMVVFSVCFLPATLARVVLLVVRVQEMDRAEEVAVEIYDGLMVLSYIDCLLDPLVYVFCYSGFKEAYMSYFCPSLMKRRQSSSSSTAETRVMKLDQSVSGL